MKYLHVALVFSLCASLAQAMPLRGLSGSYQEIAPGQFTQSTRIPGTRYGRVLFYTPVPRPITIDFRKKGRPASFKTPVASRTSSLKSAVAKRKKSLSRATSTRRQSVTGLAARQRAALANLLAGGNSNTITRVRVDRARTSTQTRRKDLPTRTYSKNTLARRQARTRRAPTRPVTTFERKRSLKEAVSARKASLRVAKAPNRKRRTLGPPPPFRTKGTITARKWVKRYQPQRLR